MRKCEASFRPSFSHVAQCSELYQGFRGACFFTCLVGGMAVSSIFPKPPERRRPQASSAKGFDRMALFFIQTSVDRL
jgi:hypothetical protein